MVYEGIPGGEDRNNHNILGFEKVLGAQKIYFSIVSHIK